MPLEEVEAENREGRNHGRGGEHDTHRKRRLQGVGETDGGSGHSGDARTHVPVRHQPIWVEITEHHFDQRLVRAPVRRTCPNAGKWNLAPADRLGFGLGPRKGLEIAKYTMWAVNPLTGERPYGRRSGKEVLCVSDQTVSTLHARPSRRP